MSSKEIIAAATAPVFYTRVAFIALKAAQNVASEDPGTANHANRAAYAGRLFRGEDKPVDMALHIAAQNATIAGKLDAGTEVPDGDLEFALSEVFNARANAFAAV